MLKRIRRLEGTALISSGILLHDDCPKGTDTKLFSRSVVQLFDELEKKEEYANDVLMKFDGGQVLLMFRYPVILCLFFNREGDLSSVEKGGNQFLTQFSSALGIFDKRGTKTKLENEPAEINQQAAEPVAIGGETGGVDEWAEYRKHIEVLFTKVLGSAQAARIVDREMKTMGIDSTGYLHKAQFRSFGQKLTKRIKDKKIRREIEDELFSIIENLD